MVCLRFACTSAGPRRRDDTFVVDATIVLRQPKAGSRARGAGDGPERWHWAGAPCGRGWTGRLTAGHLGDPDAVRPNPHCCPGAPMRPYDGNRVTAMETVRSLPAQQRGREGGRGQTRRAARPGFRSGRDGRSHAVRPSVGVGGHRLRDHGRVEGRLGAPRHFVERTIVNFPRRMDAPIATGLWRTPQHGLSDLVPLHSGFDRLRPSEP